MGGQEHRGPIGENAQCQKNSGGRGVERSTAARQKLQKGKGGEVKEKNFVVEGVYSC